MVEYICETCKKKYKNFKDYKKHINRKNKCKENPYDNLEEKNKGTFVENISSIQIEKYLNSSQCAYCKETFANKYTALRHMSSYCKIRKDLNKKRDAERNVIFNELKSKKIKEEEDELKIVRQLKEIIDSDENKKQKDETKIIQQLKGIIGYDKFKDKDSNIIQNITTDNSHITNTTHIDNSKNTNNTQNNFQNNVQNITLYGYGKEDISKIDKNLLFNGINRVYGAPLHLTKAIHFNEKFPEYNNIYIASMKDKYGMQYDGKEWNLVDKNKLIDQIYEDKKVIVADNVENFSSKLSTSKKERIKDWLDNETHPDDKGTSDVKDEMKLLLYNKRKMAMDRRDEIKKIEKKNRKDK
jgi:hypothetical protein